MQSSLFSSPALTYTFPRDWPHHCTSSQLLALAETNFSPGKKIKFAAGFPTPLALAKSGGETVKCKSPRLNILRTVCWNVEQLEILPKHIVWGSLSATWQQGWSGLLMTHCSPAWWHSGLRQWGRGDKYKWDGCELSVCQEWPLFHPQSANLETGQDPLHNSLCAMMDWDQCSLKNVTLEWLDSWI